MSEAHWHFFIFHNDTGYVCRTKFSDTHVHCEDRLDRPDAKWVFYDESANVAEPKDGGVYYIKNYGTGQWANCYAEETPIIMEMQKNTPWKVSAYNDGFVLHVKGGGVVPRLLTSWVVRDYPSPDSIIYFGYPGIVKPQTFKFPQAD